MIRIVSMVGFNVCSSFFIQLLPNINWFPRVSRNMSTNSWMVRSFPASDRKLATRFSATRMHLRNLNHQKFYKLHNFIYVLPLCDVYPSWMYRYNIYIDRYTVYIYICIHPGEMYWIYSCMELGSLILKPHKPSLWLSVGLQDWVLLGAPLLRWSQSIKHILPRPQKDD